MPRAILYLSFAVIAAMSFSSCKESSIDVPVPPREVSGTVSGTLSNWGLGGGYSLIAVAEVPSAGDSRKEGIDTASINSNGEFTMTLHAIYDKYSTEAISVSEPNCNSNINPSPYIMRQAKIRFEIYSGNTYKGYVTNAVHRIGADTVGTYYIIYNAYSSAGTITGFKVCVNSDTTYTTYYDYNINTSLGWTKIVRSVVYKDTNYVAYLESNNDPQYGVVWEFALQ